MDVVFQMFSLLYFEKVVDIVLSKGGIIAGFFLQGNADISKIKRALVRKGIFSETTYVYVLTYQISSF